MRFKQYIEEASYEGNIGMMEMFRFYEIASKKQIDLMKDLLTTKKFKEAWNFLQQVVDVKLK